MQLKNRPQVNIDMTKGNIYSLIIQFTIPLILGDLFQQLYNLTDSWVLGNFASNNEYAAVGSTMYITGVIIRGFVGLSSGAGIVIARYFGAGDNQSVKKASQTAMVIALVCSIFFTFFGLWVSPIALDATKVPIEVREYAIEYLNIIFTFVSAQIIYNMCAGILRSVGDSLKPFLYLMVAAFVNIVLDLYFVIGKGWGVKGVAWATAISQVIAALLALGEMVLTTLPVRLDFKEWLYDKEICKSMIGLGIPTAIQASINGIASMFIQSFVNALGVNYLSAFTTYHKVESVLFSSSTSLGIAAMTFVSQNLGAGNAQRAKEGSKKACIASIVYNGFLASIIILFAPQIAGAFSKDAQVIALAVLTLREITIFFPVQAPSQVLMSTLRGCGNSKAPLYINLGSHVIFRIAYLYLTTSLIGNTPIVVNSAYPSAWFICTIISYILVKRTDFEAAANKVVKQ